MEQPGEKYTHTVDEAFEVTIRELGIKGKPNYPISTDKFTRVNLVNLIYNCRIDYWLKEIIKARKEGRIIIAIIPARTDTIWWHDLVLKADIIWFVKGRIKLNSERPYVANVIACFNSQKNKGMPEFRMRSTLQ